MDMGLNSVVFIGFKKPEIKPEARCKKARPDPKPERVRPGPPEARVLQARNITNTYLDIIRWRFKSQNCYCHQ